MYNQNIQVQIDKVKLYARWNVNSKKHIQCVSFSWPVVNLFCTTNSHKYKHSFRSYIQSSKHFPVPYKASGQ